MLALTQLKGSDLPSVLFSGRKGVVQGESTRQLVHPLSSSVIRRPGFLSPSCLRVSRRLLKLQASSLHWQEEGSGEEG